MPRLTDQSYLRIHHQLRRFWLNNYIGYADLSSMEQWSLHDYFQPSKDLTDAELLEHRAAITAERPSLPARAGKAYHTLIPIVVHWAARLPAARARALQKPGRAPRGNRHITVKSVVRPEIATKALARALIQMATARAKAQAAAKAKEGGTPPPPNLTDDFAA
jgi:hypothetical protein